MLIPYNYSTPPEKYKDYKNRTIQKQVDKLDKQLNGIKQCHLKPEDKNKLRAKMLELLENYKLL